jgi:uncharacterized protein (DUF983 family)
MHIACSRQLRESISRTLSTLNGKKQGTSATRQHHSTATRPRDVCRVDYAFAPPALRSSLSRLIKVVILGVVVAVAEESSSLRLVSSRKLWKVHVVWMPLALLLSS